jgi:transcriptional regulator with XRE-family HTH domain
MSENSESMRIKHANQPGAIFGRRVREVRNRHGWTQAQLAKRLTDLGRPMDQAVVARLEAKKPSSRAVNVSLVDVLAFSAALGVSPVFLFLPLDDDAPVQVAPTLELPAGRVRDWVRGRLLPAELNVDQRIWETERDTRTLAELAHVQAEAERLRAEGEQRDAARKRRAEEYAQLSLAESAAEIEDYERRGEDPPRVVAFRYELRRKQLAEIREMTLRDWALREEIREEKAADMMFDDYPEEEQ